MSRTTALLAICLAMMGCGKSGDEAKEASPAPTGVARTATQPISHDAEIPNKDDAQTFTGIMLADDGSPVEVKYRKLGDLAVVGGDMIVGTHAELQLRLHLLRDLKDGDVDTPSLTQSQRKALEDFSDRASRAGEGGSPTRFSTMDLQLFGWGTTGKTWPGSVIPYEIGSSIPPGDRRKRIEDAIALWNGAAPIPLRPASEAKQAIAAGSAILTFVDHEAPDDEFACASWIGYRPSGKRQEIFINPKCEAGNIAHEIGHAVGLHHEHQRTDRAAFLVINSNIPNDSVNYGTLKGRHLSDHDLCSIMHYGAGTTSQRWFTLSAAGTSAFQSCEQKLDVKCRQPQPGQRCQLSEGDVASLRAFYSGKM